MENCGTRFCKLCLSFITDVNFKVMDEIIREVLGVLQLKLNLEENHEYVMCNACTEKLFAAFHFKVTCLDTDDSIFPYVDSAVTPVDLKEIYLELKGKEHLTSLLKDERICRLCMQFITSGFKTVGEIEMDWILEYVPEVNFNLTRDPVICSLCVDSLNTHSSFLKKCLRVDRKIHNMDDDCATEIPSYIKSETIEVKKEECDEYGDTYFQDDEFVDGEVKVGDNSDLLGLKHTSDVQIYKSDASNFETKYKQSLTTHQVKREDFSKVRKFKCDSCPYTTTYKTTMTRHQLNHKNFAEVQMYNCESCDYITIHKKYLKVHLLQHKDLQMYKCNTCNFKTKSRKYLTRHELNHKDISEVKIYKCEACDYTSRHWRSTKSHQQSKHKELFGNLMKHSTVRAYKCDTCDYRSNHKQTLRFHQLTHKDFSEVEVFKCDVCDYKAKLKCRLKIHKLKHKDFSEVKTYKCEECHYRSKYNGALKRHQRTHKKVL